jgi:hypothetical protein
MLFAQLKLSPRSMTAISMACLSIGLMIQLFIEPNMQLTATSLNIVHGFKGFLIGVSLATGIGSLVQLRRNRTAGS